MRTYQVDWFNRTTEKDMVSLFEDFRQAHLFAKRMSDFNDASAVIIALDDLPDGGQVASGHMEYTFGIRGERTGCLADVDWPKI